MSPFIEEFNARVSDIVHLIEITERLEHNGGEIAAWQRNANREELDILLFDLERIALITGQRPRMRSIIRALTERKKRLPRGPSYIAIKEAQSILKNPSLVILDLEETLVNGLEIPEIAQLVAIDGTGSILFDHAFISQQNVTAIAQIWPKLLSVVTGHYTISDDILLAQVQLIDTAKRYDLDIPVLIGQSILDLSLRYLNMSSRAPWHTPSQEILLDIVTLCEHLRVPLPGLPRPNALDRAISMLHIMQAMAQGVAPVYWPQDDKEADYEGIDH